MTEHVKEVIREDLGITERKGCYYSYQGGCKEFVGWLVGEPTWDNNITIRTTKPTGWCWSCWRGYQINKLSERVLMLQDPEDVADFLERVNQAEKFKIEIRNIMKMTNHNAPGIYEPSTIEEINRACRIALGVVSIPIYEWSHNNKPKDDSAPRVESKESQMWFSTPSGPGVEQLICQALRKLSGDLSNDNIAAAKQILKEIIRGSRI